MMATLDVMATLEMCECGHPGFAHVYVTDPLGREVLWCGSVFKCDCDQFRPPSATNTEHEG